MTYLPKSDSVVAFQSDGSVLLVGASILGRVPIVGSISGTIQSEQIGTRNTSISGVVNASVSGEVGASIIGTVPITQIAGSVMAVSGSFTAPPNQSVSGTVIATQIPGSVMAVSGSFTPAANQSVSGTVDASIIGTVPVTQSGTVISSISGNVDISGSVFGIVRSSVAGGIFPISGSVATVQIGQVGTQITSVSGIVDMSGSVFGTVRSSIAGGIFPVSGSVASQQIGTRITSVMNTIPSSMLVGASIIGLTPVTAVVTGNPSISGTVGASIIGTVPVVQSGTTITSISGVAYAEDTAHSTGDMGVLTLGVRNDTMSSVTSADGDYSPQAVGPVGENIVANAPINKWVQGVASCASGISQPVIAAQGASVFTYVTGLQVANFSGTSVLVALLGGVDSVIGYTIAPASGGSNVVYPNGLKTRQNAAFSASVSGAGLAYISAQGFISKI